MRNDGRQAIDVAARLKIEERIAIASPIAIV